MKTNNNNKTNKLLNKYFSIQQYLNENLKTDSNIQTSSERRILPKRSKRPFEEIIVHWFQPISNTSKTKILQYNNISINNNTPLISEVDYSTTTLRKAA